MKKEHRIQIQVEVDISEWLCKKAVMRRCSIAQVVREVLLEKMIEEEGQ